jgi:hypothetical protein
MSVDMERVGTVAHSHHTALKFARNSLDLANRLEEAIANLKGKL